MLDGFPVDRRGVRRYGLPIYGQTAASRKAAGRAGLLRPRHRRAVPIFAGGIFELLPAAFDHRR
jgi:hypothetical protein